MNNAKNNFNYSYTALTQTEKQEIESIKAKYETHESSAEVLELKKLDNKVKRTPRAVALTIGILGTLIFGTGFSMILEWNLMLFGSIVAILGIILVIIAYPIYNRLRGRLKKKYGKKIIKLSEQILMQSNETTPKN